MSYPQGNGPQWPTGQGPAGQGPAGQNTDPANDPANDPGNAAARRRRKRIGFTVAVVVVLLVVGVGIANLAGAFDGSSGSGGAPDRSDPAATGSAFASGFATHDPRVCELAAPTLAPRLQRDGRCTGAAAGVAPRVTVLVSQTCGTRHTFAAQITPPGQVGAPYVSLGLEQAGQTWAVRSVLALRDRSAIRPVTCRAPSTSYGG